MNKDSRQFFLTDKSTAHDTTQHPAEQQDKTQTTVSNVLDLDLAVENTSPLMTIPDISVATVALPGLRRSLRFTAGKTSKFDANVSNFG